MSLTYDLEQAQTMLNMLAPNGEGLTFQTFDDNVDRGSKAIIKQYHGALSTHTQTLVQLNERGAGVFITINATDGKARTKKNITAVRSVYVDFDSADPKRLDMLLNLPLLPTLIVESSTDKHHAYWIADGIPLDNFTQWQKTLISYFKMIGDEPDEAVHDLPRVMRLAGFNHCKVSSKKGLTGEPFLTKIVHEGQRYSIDDIENFINSLPAQPTAKLTSKNTNKTKLSSPILTQLFDDSQLPSLSHEQVRSLARGRWQDILGHLDYHVSSDAKGHNPCPICGGTDRFRFDDEKGTGSFICSQGTGEPIAGDGLSLLADHAGLGIHEAMQAVTAVLNDMGLISPYDDKTQPLNIEWADPEPLANDPSKPTPYPIEAFTGLLKNVVKAVAHYAQVPDAMAGQCVLGALAHIGQRFIDAPMGHNQQPASLIIIIEGESGSGKSQAMGLTHFKIKEYERQQYEAYLSDQAAWDAQKAVFKGKEVQAFLDTSPKPLNPITMFKDATIEPILDRFINKEMYNASWTTDEAGQFFNGHTMTGDTAGSALSSLTTLHSDGEVFRFRSQKSAHAMARTNAYDVRMTLVLMGQRIVLEQALTNPLMNGQGFLARALIACPNDLRGQRVWDDEQRRNDSPYDNPDLIAYWSRCQSLLDPLPANLPNDITGEPQRVKMQWADKQAEQAFYNGMQAIENRQANGQAFEFLQAYASRMAENASRIASLMAFFDERMTITTDDITRAFMLVEYSTAERLRYLDATPTGEQNDSEKLSNWLVDKAKGKNPMMLNRTYVYNGAPQPMRKNNKALQSELDNLESMGHIKQADEGKKKVIYINPKLHQ